MFIIFRFFFRRFSASVLMVIGTLHPFDSFFFLSMFAENIQQIDYLHVFVGCIFQRIGRPSIRFTAGVHKDIAGRNLHNIFCGGLIAVHVHAVVKQKGDFCIVRLIAQHCPHPIVCRKDGCDNVKRFGLCVWCACIRGCSAAGEQSCQQYQCQAKRKYFFHVCPPVC